MIVDTSALLAFFDRNEPDHSAVARALLESDEPLVVPPYVVAELDYLVATRHGTDAELAVIAELAGGAWELPGFDADDPAVAHRVIEQYADQAIGVADASIVVVADRLGTRSIATLHRRRFDVLRPLAGGRFAIVP
jgi:predicted nucleic acid-binding protein